MTRVWVDIPTRGSTVQCNSLRRVCWWQNPSSSHNKTAVTHCCLQPPPAAPSSKETHTGSCSDWSPVPQKRNFLNMFGQFLTSPMETHTGSCSDWSPVPQKRNFLNMFGQFLIRSFNGNSHRKLLRLKKNVVVVSNIIRASLSQD